MVAVFCLTPSVFSEETSDRSTHPAQSPSEENPPFIGLVTGNRVNLRAGPGSSYETLSQFSRGAKLQVVDKKSSWVAVRLPPEVPVYVSKVFLRLEGDRAFPQGRRIHVRAGAGQAFTSLGFLSDQQPVSVRRVVGEWVEIQPPDFCRGWINQAYITFLEKGERESSYGDDRGVPAVAVQGSQDPGSQAPSKR